MNSRKATISDIDGILALQEQNLFSRLSSDQLKKGFVTTPFTRRQIEESIDHSGLFITEKDMVIAYAFAGTWDFFEQWPIFPYMTSRFPQLSFSDFEISTNRTFQYGPVCVDINYRGKGIFNQVFESMRLEWAKKFPLSITFINSINKTSVRAHDKLGWKVIDQFEFNDNNYLGLAFDMKNSVL